MANARTSESAVEMGSPDAAEAMVDVVTVAYNSAGNLRQCVEPLSYLKDVSVFVVDNASSDGGLDTICNLELTSVPLRTNGGFAHGCNVGWRLGRAPYILFLNPDATITAASIDRLVNELETDRTVGAAAPLIVHPDGSNAYSLRHFPRVVSTFAQAFFLHRLLPTRSWTDELIRDPRRYRELWSPEWVSGACILVRRSLLERLNGWDERFFLFAEDMDLCRRIRDAGYAVVFDPEATCTHIGGASAPKDAMLPILMESRLRYLAKHHGRIARSLHRVGLCLSALTHIAFGRDARRGHLEALLVVASPFRRLS